jgi:hypothetical protein
MSRTGRLLGVFTAKKPISLVLRQDLLSVWILCLAPVRLCALKITCHRTVSSFSALLANLLCCEVQLLCSVTTTNDASVLTACLDLIWLIDASYLSKVKVSQAEVSV